MTHTPEPWATEYRKTGSDDDMAQEIFDINGETIASCAWYRVRKDERTTTTNRELNARRICACVNACRGIETSVLESKEHWTKTELIGLLEQINKRLRAERSQNLPLYKVEADS